MFRALKYHYIKFDRWVDQIIEEQGMNALFFFYSRLLMLTAFATLCVGTLLLLIFGD